MSDELAAEAGREFARLVGIMHQLRRECPWDRAQDHASLRTYLVEETYELLHALDAESWDEVQDELGDLALQIVFHAEIAGERDAFDICGVLRSINDKMVRRHPHVFADAEAPTADAVHRSWEDIKRSQEQKFSVLQGVPDSLPALLRAARVLAKVEHSGVHPFAGCDLDAQARRWLEALLQAASDGNAQQASQAAAMLCLVVVKLTAKAGTGAEDALREAVSRLADAFCKAEDMMRKDGRRFAELPQSSLARLEAHLLSRCEEESA